MTDFLDEYKRTLNEAYQNVSLENASFTFSMPVGPLVRYNDTVVSRSIHSHLRYELIYQIAGTSEIMLSDGSVYVNAGEVFIIPIGFYHVLKRMSEDSSFFYQNFDMVKLDAVPHSYDIYGAAEASFGHKVFKIMLSPALRQIAAEIDGNPCHWESAALFLRLLSGIIRLSGIAVKELPADADNGPEDKEMKFRRTMETYVNHRFLNDMNPDEFSKVLGLSVRQTERAVNRVYQMPIAKLRTHCRLSEASFCLLHTDMPVTEIAESVGYRNYNTFLEAFRQEFGVSPTDYRIIKQKENGNITE